MLSEQERQAAVETMKLYLTVMRACCTEMSRASESVTKLDEEQEYREAIAKGEADIAGNSAPSDSDAKFSAAYEEASRLKPGAGVSEASRAQLMEQLALLAKLERPSTAHTGLGYIHGIKIFTRIQHEFFTRRAGMKSGMDIASLFATDYAEEVVDRIVDEGPDAVDLITRCRSSRNQRVRRFVMRRIDGLWFVDRIIDSAPFNYVDDNAAGEPASKHASAYDYYYRTIGSIPVPALPPEGKWVTPVPNRVLSQLPAVDVEAQFPFLLARGELPYGFIRWPVHIWIPWAARLADASRGPGMSRFPSARRRNALRCPSCSCISATSPNCHSRRAPIYFSFCGIRCDMRSTMAGLAFYFTGAILQYCPAITCCSPFTTFTIGAS
jgi:hypothetical protein